MKHVEISVNGTAYPCSPTMGAMLRFKQETGKEITEIDPKSFSDLCTYLWCCVVSGAKREGKQFDMSLMEFADSLTPEDMAQWNAAIMSEVDPGDDGEKKEAPLAVYELLGMAVGCIGMSHDDFCKCTFEEFESICKIWREMTERQSRDTWERARTIATIIIQPHVKKKITPQQLLPLPWDKEKQNHQSEAPELTAEEKRKRFEDVAHRLGDGINR